MISFDVFAIGLAVALATGGLLGMIATARYLE